MSSAGQPLALGRREAALLGLLLAADGRVVAKDRMATTLWPGEAPSDDSIGQLVRRLRQALDAPGRLPILQTVYGAGLRLAVPVQQVAVESEATAKRLTTGQSADVAAAVLTPGNAELLARRLAALRGPAMKVGQMLSLQGDDLVPAEFRNALAMLRSQGYAMPDAQLRRVLGREYGKGWERRFEHFELEPAAAASIGQIHRARRRGGRELALKIQFPGWKRLAWTIGLCT